MPKIYHSFHPAKLRKKILLMESVSNNKAVLVHWTYNQQEWRRFIKWKKLCHSRFHLIAYYLSGRKKMEVPDITITHQKIWIGDEAEAFNDVNREVKNAVITDVGNLNVLTISYVVLNNGQKNHYEIKVPIPTGKLREAMKVSDTLRTPGLY